MKFIFTLTLSILISIPLLSQKIISFSNPSFEGESQRGMTPDSPSLKSWTDCSRLLNPTKSTIDSQTAENEFWGVKQKPSDGSSFIGLILKKSGSSESMTQQLSKKLTQNNCYSFKIDLSLSEAFLSDFPSSIKNGDYNVNTTLKVSGGSSNCDKSQELHQTKIINHIEWKTYDIRFKLNEDISYITLNAIWKTPAFHTNNGHLLIDNLQAIHKIHCSLLNRD